MPRTLVSAIALTVVGCCLSSVPLARAQSPPGATTRTDTVAIDSTGHVAISNQKGSITVTTWERSAVGYTATLTPSEGDSVLTRDFDIEHSMSEVSLGQEDSWSIQIFGLITISPDGTTAPIGHFQIVMPKTASLEIDGSASRIEVSGVEGDVEIDAVQDTVTIKGGKGKLDLDTVSGPATATGLQGNAELESVSGGLTAAFEKLETASSVETVSGPLRLYLPPDTGFVLETNADSSQIAIGEAFGPPSREDDRWIFNGGGPNLSVETTSGRIELRALEAYTRSP